MLRVCLVLPILLLVGAPLSRAEEEDQEVRKQTILAILYTNLLLTYSQSVTPNIKFICIRLAHLSARSHLLFYYFLLFDVGIMVPGHDGLEASQS